MFSFKSPKLFPIRKRTKLEVPTPFLTDSILIRGDYFGQVLSPIGEFPRRTHIGDTIFQNSNYKIVSPINGLAYFDYSKGHIFLRIDGELNYRPIFEKRDFSKEYLLEKVNELGIISLDFHNKTFADLIELFEDSSESLVVLSPYTKNGIYDFSQLVLSKLKMELDTLITNLKKIYPSSKFVNSYDTTIKPYKYPEGDPKYFIYKELNKPLQKEFPFKKIFFIGPETIYHLIKGLYYNTPFFERHLSVIMINRKGKREGQAKIYTVKNGTNLTDFLKTFKEKYEYNYFLINSFYDKPNVFEIGKDFIFDIYNHHSLIITEEKSSLSSNNVCIDCNDCSYFCPVEIDPRILLDKSNHSFEIDKCLECGLCSTYCPVQIDFYSLINNMKKENPIAHS